MQPNNVLYYADFRKSTNSIERPTKQHLRDLCVVQRKLKGFDNIICVVYFQDINTKVLNIWSAGRNKKNWIVEKLRYDPGGFWHPLRQLDRLVEQRSRRSSWQCGWDCSCCQPPRLCSWPIWTTTFFSFEFWLSQLGLYRIWRYGCLARRREQILMKLTFSGCWYPIYNETENGNEDRARCCSTLHSLG